MSKVNALYHIVFCTKNRERTLPDEYHEDLYRMIWYEIKKTKSALLRIGGVSNHIHMLIDLHPEESLSGFMRLVKAATSGWLRRDKRFPYFDGWAEGYFAHTISVETKYAVIKYISSQKQHHKTTTLSCELNRLRMSDEEN